MTVYIIQYHDNSWGAQQSSDLIIGVYSNMDEAYKKADEIQNRLIYKDDFVEVIERDVDTEEYLPDNIRD